jgi:transcriptional regulator with XRE-family HTH domain
VRGAPQSTGQIRSIGYHDGYGGRILTIDDGDFYLLEVARRVAGLTQAELARRAGTSQATVSAYERGLKTPSVKVAARLFAVLGWELSLRSRVQFTEHHPTGIVAFWAPDRLWRVPTPDYFATLHVPDLLGHTGQNEWDLAELGDRRRAYEILIRRGLPQMMIRWLDGGFLIDLWGQLDLPDPVRAAWQPAIDGATRTHSSNIFSWHYDDEDPETADLAGSPGWSSCRRHLPHHRADNAAPASTHDRRRDLTHPRPIEGPSASGGRGCIGLSVVGALRGVWGRRWLVTGGFELPAALNWSAQVERRVLIAPS